MRIAEVVMLVMALLMGGCGQGPQVAGLSPEVLQDLRSPGDRIYSFNLTGFGLGGKKQWELFGNRAQLIEELIYLTDVISIAYGEEETVRVRSDRGTFNRQSTVATLEENVVSTIEPKKGTPQAAPGAKGPTIITCTGPLDVDLDEQIAYFHDNVVVTDPEGKIFCDLLEVYFGQAGAAASEEPGQRRMTKMIARQNVKIIQEGKITYCEQATYTLTDRRIKIEGSPRVEVMESALTTEPQNSTEAQDHNTTETQRGSE